ncbi:ubiquitin interaction motif protein [Aspergillus cavernicola]|uniref:Ubiquitin interaction motif protein n=1 Tax=Aspergillus cavernicola TaxID=176166 RepID=A0ABR4HUP3_9EURO
MTSEPSEEAIISFTSFTNTTRDQAISFLKANDLDSNKAINAYFEDPTGPQTQVVAAYRDESTASAYQIEHSDAVPASPTLGPLSRPPSALNLKDSTHATELQPPQAPVQDTKAKPGNGLSLAEQEERQLQQAVAMSLNQNLGQQETGVTSSNRNFGRATRDHYDEGAWAMTLFNSSAREIVISSDPVDRKRQANEPPFIRPSQDGLHLSGLLTILHSIPLAREALLLRNNVLSNYGHDAQWWNGQPINLPKIVTIHEAQDGDTDWDDILYETQRIVAFLDSTIRAFGSADALAGLKCMDSYDSISPIGKFLEKWQESAVRADPGNQLTTVFSSTAYKRPPAPYDTPIDKEFFNLEPYVGALHGQTLYDVLDGAMWSDSPKEELDDVWLEHVADILTITLDSVSTTAKAADVKIPSAFYPDRYLASCRDVTREYRIQRLHVCEDILRLQSLVDRYSAPKGPGAGVTPRDILEKAADAAAMLTPKSAPSDSEMTTEGSMAGVQKLAFELKAISQKIEAKLQELEVQKQQAMESLRSYSKFLTEPSSSLGDPPVHKYTLRGVCTEPHVTYVLRRSMHDPENDNTETADYEWWRISFSVDDAKSRQAESGRNGSGPKDADVIGYTAHKIREVEVLRAAREESKNVLLVYANSNAMNFKQEPVPPALQAFVNADNAAFEAELQEWEATATTTEDTINAAQGALDEEWGQPIGSRPAYPSPTINEEGHLEDLAASKVNVFDYQVSSFDDEPGQEMQERGGRSLLGQSGQPQDDPAWR